MLNKRIAPLVIQNVEGPVPGGLARLNYIYCISDDDFEVAFDNLIVALNTNIDWIREHTRLDELSRHWSESGEAGNRLSRGIDIEAAEQWAASPPKTALHPMELIIRFIQASRADHEMRRRQVRRSKAVLRVLLFALSVGLIGWIYQVQIRAFAFKLLYARPKVLTSEQERALRPLASFSPIYSP